MPRALDQDFARRVGRGLAFVRCLIGVGALLTPHLVTAPWLGKSDGRRPSVRLLARALGGRDLALGAAVLMSVNDAELARAVMLGATADGVDLTATLLSYRVLPRGWRLGVLASTLGAATAGALISASLAGTTNR